MNEVKEVAVAGEDGRALTVLIHRKTISTSPLYARTRVAGPQTFTLKETGEEVTALERGVYQLKATGERLTARDPGAP